MFNTLKETQVLIEQWRQHFNTVRPHSALGYRPPAPPEPNQLSTAHRWSSPRNLVQQKRKFLGTVNP